MASGVAVNDDCKTKFQELKMDKAHRYVLYTLASDMKEIIVEKTGPREHTYDDFVSELKRAEDNGECRFALFDADYTYKGVPKQKICFFHWSPDTAKIKQKMVYASSKDALKNALGEGRGKEIQACDHGDLEWDQIESIIVKTERH